VTFGLTAVAGLSVGHFTDARRPTGCTVVLAEGGAVCGVDVRGAAPGTRETELLAPVNAVQKVHAVLLAGGSAFGLDAAGGVMRWLDERGIGVAVGPTRGDRGKVTVPIVPAAILFDLWVGDARIRPDAAAGYAACQVASRDTPAEGNVGAGAGATLGKLFGIDRAMRGGVGEPVARPADREALLVEQLAYAPDEQHLVVLVIAAVAAPLHRLELRELLLPVAQHVRLDAAQLAHFADREVALSGDRREGFLHENQQDQEINLDFTRTRPPAACRLARLPSVCDLREMSRHDGP